MEKRYQSIDSMIVINVIIPLGPSEQKKLENKDLEPRIDAIAKDMHVDWAVEVNGNTTVVAISRTYGPVVSEKESHEIEIAATNFMTAIEHIKVETELKKKDPDEELANDIKFAREVLEEWDETDKRMGTVGAKLLCRKKGLPFTVTEYGHISGRLLKKMFEAFIKLNS